MKNFECFYLLEWKLPQTNYIIDFIKENNYISAIAKQARKIQKYKKDIHIVTVKITNPYNNEEETINIFLVYRPAESIVGNATKSKNEPKWTIILNYPQIEKEAKETNLSFEEAINQVLQHEITHAIDLQSRYIDYGKYDLKDKLKNKPTTAKYYQPGEINARIRDVVSIIKYNIETGNINLTDLKNTLTTKNNKNLIKWISDLPNIGAGNLYFYMLYPDIIERIRKVLYNEFF